jgi:transposase
MLVHQAFRYELAPTAAQRAALTNHAGAARWAWNWGLAVRQKAWKRRSETLNAVELHRLLNRLKRTQRYSWLYEVSKCAPQEALRDLDRAYTNWWRGCKQERRVGAPRFKKRGRCPERFRLTGAIRVEPEAVVLPRIGRVRTKETTGKFRGRILSATCRREADRWYCSLTVQVERPDPEPVQGPVVGIDRGVASFAVCSDATTIEGPRLVLADRFYPSTKTCSGCGLVKAMPLNVRVFSCAACGLVLNRDLNAAYNLARLAGVGLVAGSSLETRNACGGGSADAVGNGGVELPSTKQERNPVLAGKDA